MQYQTPSRPQGKRHKQQAGTLIAESALRTNDTELVFRKWYLPLIMVRNLSAHEFSQEWSNHMLTSEFANPIVFNLK